ncbi:MAG: transglutaminaseTgpA domain-containing protein, partial [Bdellovibrionales bacterium]|nr:transglutaminaseTgpA domain-containing protein [Bdellovibrionales bacterium]
MFGVSTKAAEAGSLQTVTIALKNGSKNPKLHLQVWLAGQAINDQTFSLAPNTIETITVALQSPPRRGIFEGPAIGVGSRAPYGLLFVWIVKRPKYEIAIAPSPLGQQPLPLPRPEQGTEYSSHRDYVPGDSLNRLDWKVVARGGGWKIKEFESTAESEAHLDLDAVAGSDLELKLQQLSQWLHQAVLLRIPFSMRLKEQKLGLGQGPEHLERGLKMLARYNTAPLLLPRVKDWIRRALKEFFFNSNRRHISQQTFQTLMILAPIAAHPIASEAPGLCRGLISTFSVLSILLSFERIQKFLRQRLPGYRSLSSIMALIAFTATGIAFQWVPSTESAATLLALVILSKGFELRAFRDALVQILGINLVMMSTLLFYQDIYHTLLMIAVVVQSFVSLREINFSEEKKSGLFSGLKQLFHWDLLVTVPLIVILFIFFPRFVSPFAQWVENQPSTQTGYSEAIDLSQMAHLAMSSEIAFRVEFLSKRPSRDLYWRG